PHLVALSKKYPDHLACISLSFDNEGIGATEEERERNLEKVQEKVLKFLISQQATLDNVLASEEADSLYHKFDMVSVPTVFIYDKQGKLVKRFDNSEGEEVTYAQIEQFLTENFAELK